MNRSSATSATAALAAAWEVARHTLFDHSFYGNATAYCICAKVK